MSDGRLLSPPRILDVSEQEVLFQIICFNPRPRMGGDCSTGNITQFWICFNPRPRMGGDCVSVPPSLCCLSFNPRPRMGGDYDRDCGRDYE